jgi:hypothetical protein
MCRARMFEVKLIPFCAGHLAEDRAPDTLWLLVDEKRTHSKYRYFSVAMIVPDSMEWVKIGRTGNRVGTGVWLKTSGMKLSLDFPDEAPVSSIIASRRTPSGYGRSSPRCLVA